MSVERNALNVIGCSLGSKIINILLLLVLAMGHKPLRAKLSVFIVITLLQLFPCCALLFILPVIFSVSFRPAYISFVLQIPQGGTSRHVCTCVSPCRACNSPCDSPECVQSYTFLKIWTLSF